MALLHTPPQQVTLALTGASGMPYAQGLLAALIQADCQVNLLISQAAQVVISTETDWLLSGDLQAQADYLSNQLQARPGQLTVLGKQQWMSSVASGSGAGDVMVICPCSTGTLSALATGASDNLIERAADVHLKERRPLLLVPREAPYNAIHLENMLKLTHLGALVLPASPGFYHHPQSIKDLVDFVVARILDQLAIPQNLIARWGYQGR